MKSRRFCKPQQFYMIAKANLEVVEKSHHAAEIAFIKSKGIVNPDGMTPEWIYRIEDEAAMEAVGVEFDEVPENKRMWEEILAARETLKTAEENLLDYALNVVPIPEKEKAVLTESVKTNYTIRKKLIDAVMKLDVSTLPKHLILR